jgi:hypothetical protein
VTSMAQRLPERRPNDENVIDDLICKATRAHAFSDPGNSYFSSNSVADILDVTSKGSVLRSNVKDEELRSAIQVLVVTPHALHRELISV